MKKALLILLALVAGFLISHAAPEFVGTWSGYITQKSPMALASNYRFSLELSCDGDEISGHSEIGLWDEADIIGVMALTGTFNENELELKETEIIRQHLYSYAYWCLKSLHLQYLEEDGKQILRGRWDSEACSGPGDVYLERAKNA